jgi:hypothetical protein
MTPPRPDAEQLANRIALATVRRAALAEAVGVLRSWQRCGTAEAHQTLTADSAIHGQDAEAARVAAIVNGLAENGADPDWD